MAAVLAGCGDEPLSEADEKAVSRAMGDLSFYCPTDSAPERPRRTSSAGWTA